MKKAEVDLDNNMEIRAELEECGKVICRTNKLGMNTVVLKRL